MSLLSFEIGYDLVWLHFVEFVKAFSSDHDAYGRVNLKAFSSASIHVRYIVNVDKRSIERTKEDSVTEG